MAKKSRRAPVSRDKRFKKNNASDFGPNERWQHGGHQLEFTETAGIFALRATEEHVLDRLLFMKIIETAEHEAGLKLHQDYHLAGIESRLTASYASVRITVRDAEARLQRNDAEETAYQRWRGALSAIPSSMRDTIIHVACIGMLPTIAQLGKLKSGLFMLARHYGLAR